MANESDVITIKKALKIILIILGALVVLIGVFAFIQRDNLSALHQAMSQDQTEIKAEMQIAEQDLANALDVDLEKIKANAAEIYAAEIGVEPPVVQENADQPASGQPEAQPVQAAAANGSDSQVEDLIAQFYVLEARYTDKLSAIEASASERLHSIPSGKRSKRVMLSIVSECISEASAIESECDSEVQALISQLKALLEKNGGDTSPATEIENYYETEKGLKKAEYMSKYINYLS